MEEEEIESYCERFKSSKGAEVAGALPGIFGRCILRQARFSTTPERSAREADVCSAIKTSQQCRANVSCI